MKFTEIDFKPHPNWPDGVQAVVRFPNDYGASIIRSQYSYGGTDGLYELAVVHFKGDDWAIDYSTPITSDVIGHLTEDAVVSLLTQIEAL